jgi:hypothetical protein
MAALSWYARVRATPVRLWAVLDSRPWPVVGPACVRRRALVYVQTLETTNQQEVIKEEYS